MSGDIAPSPAPVWPDEATVERVKDALFIEFHRTGQLGDMARAALSVLSDPTADTVLLGKVREIVAEWERTVEAQDSPWPDYLDPLIARDSFIEIVDLLTGGS